jgi:hypothetical protein
MSASDVTSIALPIVIILLVTVIFLRTSRRLRKRGGSFTSILLGSTYELHSKDRREAIEVIVEEKAGKKREETESGDSDDGESPEKPPNERED